MNNTANFTDAFDALASALTPVSNDILSLKKGIVKTLKNTATPYTILLVGETNVGKSSVLELIAKVLAGDVTDHYDFNVLEHTKERGGSVNQSETNSVRLYELTSKNGIVVSASTCEHREHA